MLLCDAPALHAAVGCFNDDRCTQGLQFTLQIVDNALRDSFLILQPSCVKFQYSGQFADANNSLDRDVCNMCATSERLQMVFAR